MKIKNGNPPIHLTVKTHGLSWVFLCNKELQANTHRFIDEDIKEKNARGKKSSWTKATLKKAARHLRRLKNKINDTED